jgi:outer membrane receptor protein involved in Fe transport
LGGIFPQIGPVIPPALNITGRVGLGSGSSGDSITVNESMQFSDGIHWNRGSHSIKFGFELLNLRYLNRGFPDSMGNFSFTGAITGNPAADFLIGKPATMTVSSPVLEQSGLQSNTFYYIQDDWRIHPRLTLNLGLRYELPLPWVHPNNWWGTLHPGKQSQVIPNAPVGMVFYGDPGVPRGMIQTDKNNFSPRFGFAWDPFGNGRTSVRAAFGIFYEGVTSDIIQNTSGQPFRYSFTIPAPYSLTDPLRGQPPVPLVVNLKDPTFVGLQQIFNPDPSFRTGYVEAFNLNIQREVLRDLSVQVAYVGKLGRKLKMTMPSNPAVWAPGATLGNINARRIMQGFGATSKYSSESNSGYNALQVEVNKRFSRGFSLQGAYTFSRSLDNNSSISGATVPNPFDLRNDYGLADFFAKHIASFSWIWDLPKLQSSSTVVRAVAGGWQVNGLVTGRTGMPFNVQVGSDVALSGTSGQRPDVVGEHRLPEDRSRGEKIRSWFSGAAFAIPPAGTYGNVGRNALLGPAAANTNIGLLKNFGLRVREGARLQFRSEFFNIFNSVNLGTPNATLVSGSNFGRITGAGEARVIQFALKVLF